MVKKASTGDVIQRHLLKQLQKCTPYVRSEASMICRYDMAMYIPEMHSPPFEMPEDNKNHCYRLMKRNYCDEKWVEKKNELRIPHEERQHRVDEIKKEVPDKIFIWDDVPHFRNNGKEYKTDNGLFKAVKEECKCDPDGCEHYAKQLDREKKHRESYGFMHGLHLFEVKADMDNHKLLTHQIPNMLSFGNYIWLVLGENQKVPEWLPPYISILRFVEKGKKFKVERHNRIEIKQPIMYRHVLDNQDIPVKIENKELYAFSRLVYKWKLNSLFHFQNQENSIMDMGSELQELLKFLRRFDKKNEKERERHFQKSLKQFQGDLVE